VLGYPPSAFDGDPDLFRRLVHPDDRALVDPDAVAWRDGHPVVVRMQHADGRWIWLEQRGTPVLNAEGDPVAVDGVARDVTEQRRVEAALARVNRVQRTLSAANEALVRADEELPLLEAICRAVIEEGGFLFAWVGYCEDDEAGTIRPIAHAGRGEGYLDEIAVSWHDNDHGRGPTGVAAREGRPAFSREIAADPAMTPWVEAALARGYASSASFPLGRGDGVFGVLSIYSAEPDAFVPQEVSLLVELAADLSYGVDALRTRAAGAAAEADRRRLAMAIEQTADTVVITDLDGRVVYVNPAIERALGYERAEVVGRPPEVTDAIFGMSVLDPAITSSDTAGRVWSATLPYRRKDGSIAEFDVVVTPVRDERGTPIGTVGVGRDTSRERELAAQLRQAEKMQAVGELAGGIAHDFNNLLTVIRGYAELHLASHPEPDPERLDVDELARAADRAAELVRQLLAVGRRQAVHPERLDLAEVVTTALPMLGRVVGEGVEITTQATTPTPQVLADRGQLERVLLNLAANSRDAMPGGGLVTIEVRPVMLDEDFLATHQGARAGAHAMLAVSDTGVGMDAATMAHLFEPFFTTKEPGRGTGLGLASAYGIVKQAGGSIFGESEPGRGCTFRIYLPEVDAVDAVDAADATGPTDPAISSGPTAGTETVHLVEDEPGVRAFARRSLERHGYSVVAFGSPAEALDFAAEHPAACDALVTDMVMPAMSGGAVAERLRALRPDLPVLFITAYGDVNPKAPRAPVVAKPFTGLELARALRAVLDAR
jgi:PAS domain S-box-containing protein